jgi:type I restriction enzyme S subunit
MSTWREYSVEDIAASTPHALATGPFGSSISSRFFQTDGIPVIRGSNLSRDVGTRLVDDDWVFISEEKAEEFSRSIVRCDDLVFTCWGTIDQVGLIDKSATYPRYVISNKQMKLTPDPTRFDSHFLYYLFKSPDVREHIRSISIGSSVPGFNLGQLRSIRIRAPELKEQREIAHVLCVIDEKIQLNRRMSREMEELGGAFFTSWFVDFDPVEARRSGQRQPVGVPLDAVNLFPSHFEDSELGPLPQGWSATSIGEHFNVTMGQSPPGSTYNESGNGLPFYQGRTDFGFRFPTRRVFCTAPTRLADEGDTLVSVRAPVGDTNVASERCAIGRGVAAVRHKGGYPSFTYYTMRSLRDEFDVYEGEGTLFGAIGGQDFRRLPFIHPTPEILAAFEAIVGPMDALIAANERESRTLAELRSALLGPLLSGELTLKTAEKTVEAAV